jgi:hypothetical protein
MELDQRLLALKVMEVELIEEMLQQETVLRKRQLLEAAKGPR